MVATPRQDGLTDRIKAINRQLDVLSRTRFVQYQRVPMLATAPSNNYSNTMTTPVQLAVGGYTFSAAVPALHFGWWVQFTASGGAAAAQLQVQAVDGLTGSTTTLLTITGSTAGAGVLTAAVAGSLTGVIDTVFSVPSSWDGHRAVLQCYSRMLSGTGTITAYPVYVQEAAS